MFLMSSAFDFDIYRLWCVDWHITRLAKNGFKLFLAEFLFKKIVKIGKKKKKTWSGEIWVFRDFW